MVISDVNTDLLSIDGVSFITLFKLDIKFQDGYFMMPTYRRVVAFHAKFLNIFTALQMSVVHINPSAVSICSIISCSLAPI